MKTVVITLVLLVIPTLCFAADKSIDEQFIAIGAARTHADLAIRKVRALSEETEGKWRTIAAATEVAHGQVLEALRKAVEDEQKRAEELRNPAVIDELNQRRATVEQDWQRYASVERPTMDANYRQPIAALGTVAQIFANVNNIESVWKDAKLDLTPLQESYEAVAKRAEEIKAQADKAVADFVATQKQWETVAKAATQPTPSAAPVPTETKKAK